MNATLLVASLAAVTANSNLEFDVTKFVPKQSLVNGSDLRYRAVENVVYVQHPVDEKYQTLNVYVPEAYFKGETINGYSSRSAPIFFPNYVGGYMPSMAQKPGAGMESRNNAILRAIAHGYVVVTPGARGRTLKDESGAYYGKAPAAIVDLKAAVRYVRSNRGKIPGDTEKIVSNGTSAGGALSALLGASGNNPDYSKYLSDLGAADARDDVWAVSAYCPITNLDNADMAYEWLLNGVNEARSFGRPLPPLPGGKPPADMLPAGPPPGAGNNPFGQPMTKPGPMTPAQQAHSAALKAMFPAYVNSLHLKAPNGSSLTLQSDGTGSFQEFVEAYVVQSARSAKEKGIDVSATPWVKMVNGQVSGIDWPAFVRGVGRMKQTSAFDGLDLGTGENNLFGSPTTDSRHFTDYGTKNSVAANARTAEKSVVKMMNPMSYLGTKGTQTATHWRIRHGTLDRDTSLAIPAILATKLSNLGLDVDLALPWNTPHSGDYDLDDLFAWIDHRAKP